MIMHPLVSSSPEYLYSTCIVYTAYAHAWITHTVQHIYTLYMHVPIIAPETIIYSTYTWNTEIVEKNLSLWLEQKEPPLDKDY